MARPPGPSRGASALRMAHARREALDAVAEPGHRGGSSAGGLAARRAAHRRGWPAQAGSVRRSRARAIRWALKQRFVRNRRPYVSRKASVGGADIPALSRAGRPRASGAANPTNADQVCVSASEGPGGRAREAPIAHGMENPGQTRAAPPAHGTETPAPTRTAVAPRHRGRTLALRDRGPRPLQALPRPRAPARRRRRAPLALPPPLPHREGRRRPLLLGRARRAGRLPRPQRRRQDDHPQDPLRPPPPDRRRGRRWRATSRGAASRSS